MRWEKVLVLVCPPKVMVHARCVCPCSIKFHCDILYSASMFPLLSYSPDLILSPNPSLVYSKFLFSDWMLIFNYFLALLWILNLLGESGFSNVSLALKIRHCKLQFSQLCIITLWLRHFHVPVDTLMLLHLIFKLTTTVNRVRASLRSIPEVLGNTSPFKNSFNRIKYSYSRIIKILSNHSGWIWFST